MDYPLKDILDIPRLQHLLGSLEEIQSLPSAVFDKDGAILIASAWQDICVHFHRTNPETEKQCKESDRYIESKLEERDPIAMYRCPMGLVDAAMPIVVEGEHLGNIFVGQVFTENPNVEYFCTKQENMDSKKTTTWQQWIKSLSYQNRPYTIS